MKTLLKIFAGLVVLTFIAAVAGFIYARALFLPAAGSPAPVAVTVPYGSSVNRVAELLETKGIIRSRHAFWVMTKLTDGAHNLKAGEYSLSPHMTIEEIIKKLMAGETQTITVTIPEGLTVAETRRKLAASGLMTEAEFDAAVSAPDLTGLAGYRVDTVEGVLFPDTYVFARGAKPGDVVRLMVRSFKGKVPAGVAEAEKKLGMPFSKILVMASLIEKEARRDEDRSKIASVFYNRMKKKMRLESCATVQYILGDNRKSRLLHSDLQIDSPYNTYKNEGLPPTPICNPSKKSIQAACEPADTDFLFFVAKPDGFHVFTKTFQEHSAAIREIRKNSRNSSGAETDEI